MYLTTYPELSPLRRLLYGLTKGKTEAVVRLRLPSDSLDWAPFGIRIYHGDITLGPPQDF